MPWFLHISSYNWKTAPFGLSVAQRSRRLLEQTWQTLFFDSAADAATLRTNGLQHAHRDFCRNYRIYRRLVVTLLVVSLGIAPAFAFDPSLSPRLGISLSTLQTTLGKVAGPVTFAPRPGSSQGTQETRLPENAGVVQAGSSPENLSVVVLWMPVDAQGKLAGAKPKLYLEALVRLF